MFPSWRKSRATRNPEEVLPIRFGESPVAFGDVRGDGERGTIQLIDEKTVAPWKLFGVLAYGVGEVDRLLGDKQLLEGECHHSGLMKSGESGKETAGEQRKWIVTSPLSLLSCSIFWPEAKKSGRPAMDIS